MASFDVVSLYTNIPVGETIENTLDRKLFKLLHDLCTKDNVFVFSHELYKQIDGATIGGCVSSTLAENFLCFCEKKWLEQCLPDFKIVFL